MLHLFAHWSMIATIFERQSCNDIRTTIVVLLLGGEVLQGRTHSDNHDTVVVFFVSRLSCDVGCQLFICIGGAECNRPNWTPIGLTTRAAVGGMWWHENNNSPGSLNFVEGRDAERQWCRRYNRIIAEAATDGSFDTSCDDTHTHPMARLCKT